MLRRAIISLATLMLASSLHAIAPAAAQTGLDSPKDLKELDKLEGYDQLPDEKGIKKELTDVPKQQIETVIIWSEAKPSSGKAPLTVQFAADPPPGVVNPVYSWQFSDGSSAMQGQQVSHTFQTPGVYRVLLKVSTAAGALGEDELRVKVQ